ncbi:MAG: hypothetical protein J0H43_14725 [Actinobacteria bacterium]|nr:hypothetical protein [Actinomycetota bacterium]
MLGRSNVRLQVAAPGGNLEVQQGNGQLVVIDRSTGKITSINLGTLLVGGSRAEPAGNAVKVLLAGSVMYVVNLANGTVQAVDPATQANIGTPWSAGHPLIDVGIDGQQNVWALDSTNRLVSLRWAAASDTLATVSQQSVAGAGAGSVIVGHDQGVTVVGAGGTILQAGTGHDSEITAPQVKGPLSGPRSSPDSLVPVSDPGNSSVVIVNQSSAVVDDVSGLGCPNPGAPTVFNDDVYVPCLGSQQVIVLNGQGQSAGPAIPVPPGGDPQLTISGGQLLIDVPGSNNATVVNPGGNTWQFPTYDPTVPPQNPNTPPPPPPPPPVVQPPHHDRGGGHHHGDTPNNGGGHGQHGDGNNGDGSSSSPATSSSASSSASSSSASPSGSTSPSSGPSQPSAPGTGTATATARPDGTVLVSWTGSPAPGGFLITMADTGQQVADVPTGATSATVTVLTPGTVASLVVHAFADQTRQRELWTATTNTVTAITAPGAPTGVQTSVTHTGGSAQITVSWTAGPANGGAVSYTVAATGASATTTTAGTSAQIEVPCSGTGCSGTVTVTPNNAAGDGPAGQATFQAGPAVSVGKQNPPPTDPTTPAATPPPAPPAVPAGGQSMVTITSSTPGTSDGSDAVVNLTITMPADWQAWNGTCELDDNGALSRSLTCSQATTTTSLYYGVSGSHTYTVVAKGSGTATSASATRTVIVRPVCVQSAGARSLTGGADYPALPLCNNCPGQVNRPVQCMPQFAAQSQRVSAVRVSTPRVVGTATSIRAGSGQGASPVPVGAVFGATLTALLLFGRRWWQL